MTLYIFNPDHDLALASGLANFTPPHAGRQLRLDLGWLPALWETGNDDWVLTTDAEKATRAVSRRKVNTSRFTDTRKPVPQGIDSIAPWGWNAALKAELSRWGIDRRLLPTEEQLADIRMLSHRRTAALLLPLLQTEGTVGVMNECSTEEQVTERVASCGKAVLKAPWSSSGRGVRFVKMSDLQGPAASATIKGWLRNTLQRQQSVMVEPCYHSVKDFGMEFMAHADGTVSFMGLSLFHTRNGAYTGNIIATEQTKHELLGRYVSTELLKRIRENICQLMPSVLKGRYQGLFGIDMMVVAGGLLHPCIEINLRRTMGHTALALARTLNPDNDDELRHVMRIEYANNHYQLRIRKL